MTRNSELSRGKHHLGAALDRFDANTRTLKANASGHERLAFLEILRAADVVGYMKAFGSRFEYPGMPNYLQTAWWGIASSLDLFAAETMNGEGVTWSPQDPVRSAWADAVLYRAGQIANVRRLRELERYGLAEVSSSDDTLTFTVHATDVEAVDRDALDWYVERRAQINRPLLEGVRAVLDDWVDDELEARVSTDAHFGIRYSSCRELEEYFELQSELRTQSLPGSDAFPDNAKFGSLTYGQYRTAVVTGMARCLKHAAFVEKLSERGPHFGHRSMWTIFSRDDELAEQWGGLMGLDQPAASRMLENLGLSIDDHRELEQTFDTPQPFLVRASGIQWFQPVYGGLNNPFSWLNRKLRRAHPTAWDRAVNARELAFRRDLADLFPEPRFYVSPTTHKLRDAQGVRTDIDAVVVDRSAGTMGLFQLKWQDVFERSLRERESRGRNLFREGNKWVERTTAYIGGGDASTCARRLGLPPSEAARIRSVLMFVLTRNAARFSGDFRPDRRAAWLSWYDLLRRCDEARIDPDLLQAVWSSVSAPPDHPPAPGVPHTFVVDDVAVNVRYEPQTA